MKKTFLGHEEKIHLTEGNFLCQTSNFRSFELVLCCSKLSFVLNFLLSLQCLVRLLLTLSQVPSGRDDEEENIRLHHLEQNIVIPRQYVHTLLMTIFFSTVGLTGITDSYRVTSSLQRCHRLWPEKRPMRRRRQKLHQRHRPKAKKSRKILKT